MPLDISIVIPVYGCDGCLHQLYRRLVASLEAEGLEFEIIFVDDCGPGNPWKILTEIAGHDQRVHGLKLSRNFGQHYAITAGVDHARGTWLVVMDCDLQDRPEEIPRLLQKAQEGFDIVVARRSKRRDCWPKRFASWVFHKTWSYMTEQESDAAQGNFGIYSNNLTAHLKELPEHARLFPLLVRWLGFTPATIEVQHEARPQGRSSYTWRKLFSLAANGIVSYSNKPLKLCIKVGFAMSAFSFCYGMWIIFHYFITPGYTLMGWSSIMVSMYFLSGLLLSGMGILGVYIGRIFDEVKGRPLYIISEKTRNNLNK